MNKKNNERYLQNNYYESALSSYEIWSSNINEELVELKVQVEKKKHGDEFKEPFNVNNIFRVISFLGMPHNLILESLKQIMDTLKRRDFSINPNLKPSDIRQIAFHVIRSLPAAENYYWALKYERICTDRMIAYENSEGEIINYENVEALKDEVKKIIKILFDLVEEFDESLTINEEDINAWSEEVVDSLKLGWDRSDLSFKELSDEIRGFAVIPPQHWFAEKFYTKEFKNITTSLSMAKYILEIDPDPRRLKVFLDEALNGILKILSLQMKFQLETKKTQIDIDSYKDLSSIITENMTEVKEILMNIEIQEEKFFAGFEVCKYISNLKEKKYSEEINVNKIKKIMKFTKTISLLHDYERLKIQHGNFTDKIEFIFRNSGSVSLSSKDKSYIKYEIDFTSSAGKSILNNKKSLILHVCKDEIPLEKDQIKVLFNEMNKFENAFCIIASPLKMEENIKRISQSLFQLENNSICIIIDKDDISELLDDPGQLEHIIAAKIMNCYKQASSTPRYKRAKVEALIIEEILKLDEGERLEFKESLLWDVNKDERSKDLEEVIIKEVAAFINTSGGVILIGVTDDKKPVGLEKDFSCLKRRPDRDGWEQHLINLIKRDLLEGATLFGNHIRLEWEKVSDNDICKLVIIPSKLGYIYYLGKIKDRKPEPQVFIRIGCTISQLNIKDAHKYAKRKWG